MISRLVRAVYSAFLFSQTTPVHALRPPSALRLWRLVDRSRRVCFQPSLCPNIGKFFERVNDAPTTIRGAVVVGIGLWWRVLVRINVGIDALARDARALISPPLASTTFSFDLVVVSSRITPVATKVVRVAEHFVVVAVRRESRSIQTTMTSFQRHTPAHYRHIIVFDGAAYLEAVFKTGRQYNARKQPGDKRVPVCEPPRAGVIPQF